LHGMAVEVGSHRGEYASAFLERWSSGFLFCIDPWYNPPGYEEQATYLHISRGEDRRGDYQACHEAMCRVDPKGKRHHLIPSLSLDAVTLFHDDSLDFVYIDADHTRPAIDNDLKAWWPKVKVGGLLVQPAVMEFATRHGVDVWLIAEKDLFPWSYYFVKE
jgi:hypothetical protein